MAFLEGNNLIEDIVDDRDQVLRKCFAKFGIARGRLKIFAFSIIELRQLVCRIFPAGTTARACRWLGKITGYLRFGALWPDHG
ncbi:MAG: hypothetical protein OXC26_03665 [Albidovulum sp.]|nr:hypothetical protein [Albidovulum sp.]